MKKPGFNRAIGAETVESVESVESVETVETDETPKSVAFKTFDGNTALLWHGEPLSALPKWMGEHGGLLIKRNQGQVFVQSATGVRVYPAEHFTIPEAE